MAEKVEPKLTVGAHGFAWGPVLVERRTSLPDGTVVIGIQTDSGKDFDIYVSPGGRSVRVIADCEVVARV